MFTKICRCHFPISLGLAVTGIDGLKKSAGTFQRVLHRFFLTIISGPSLEHLDNHNFHNAHMNLCWIILMHCC